MQATIHLEKNQHTNEGTGYPIEEKIKADLTKNSTASSSIRKVTKSLCDVRSYRGSSIERSSFILNARTTPIATPTESAYTSSTPSDSPSDAPSATQSASTSTTPRASPNENDWAKSLSDRGLSGVHGARSSDRGLSNRRHYDVAE